MPIEKYINDALNAISAYKKQQASFLAVLEAKKDFMPPESYASMCELFTMIHKAGFLSAYMALGPVTIPEVNSKLIINYLNEFENGAFFDSVENLLELTKQAAPNPPYVPTSRSFPA